MKILLVFSLLIAYCLAQTTYVDFTAVYTANATQCLNGAGTSTGSCVISMTYTASTMLLKATFACTNLQGNITAIHLHDVGAGYSLTWYTGGVVDQTKFPVTIPTDGSDPSISWTLDQATIDIICYEQGYWQVHTTSDPNCEVRANIASIAPFCAISNGVTPGGDVVTVGTAPTGTGTFPYPSFYGAWELDIIYADGSSTGGYFYWSYDSATSVFLLSGNVYGLTSRVTGIYLSFPADYYTYFISFSYYSWEQSAPFSFKYTITDEWQLAKLVSGQCNITVETADFPNGQLTLIVTNTAFPTSSATCKPYTGYTIPTDPIDCYYGTDSYKYSYTCSQGQICAIYNLAGTETYTCIDPVNYGFHCSCGATITDLSSSQYYVCDTALCNGFGVAILSCVLPSGASTMVSSVLLSLIFAFIMKWFN